MNIFAKVRESRIHIFSQQERNILPQLPLIPPGSPPLSKTEDNNEKEFFKIKLFDIERRKFHTCSQFYP